jgi:uncharacterized membrane protein
MIMRIFVVLLCLAMSACNYNIAKKDGSTNSDIANLSAKMTYAQINELVLGPKCLQCHDGVQRSDLRSYEKVFAAREDIYTRVFIVKTMPKSPVSMSENEGELLKTWLKAGAPQFADSPTQEVPVRTPPEQAVYWQDLKDKFYQAKCISCHFAGNTDGLSDYSDYATVRATIATIYYSSVITDSMPPRPAGFDPEQPNPLALTKAEKTLLSQWIVDGLPEKAQTLGD